MSQGPAKSRLESLTALIPLANPLLTMLSHLIQLAGRRPVRRSLAPPGYRRLERSELTEAVRRLIPETRSLLVLFGGDLSWAPDYADAIQYVADSGKRVVVVCPADVVSLPGPRSRAAELARRGACILKTPHDTSVLGVLVDPDAMDALYYSIIHLHLPEFPESEPGLRGGPGDHYFACLYTKNTGLAILNLATAVYRLADLQSPGVLTEIEHPDTVP